VRRRAGPAGAEEQEDRCAASHATHAVLWEPSGRAMGPAGAKKREEIYAAFEAIYPVLQEFRKGDVEPAPRLPPPGAPLLALPQAPVRP
jgi:hypothetical protein